MKRFIRTAMTVMLAVMAVACSSDEEQPIPESRGTVRVSINGIINGYTPQDATRAIAQNVVRIMWQGGETVYVYEGTKYLGSLTATKGDDAGTYATLSGDINSLTPGKTLTLVYSPQFGETAPTAAEGKLSLDLSTQADGEVPFLIYATMPATEATEVSDASVRFDLATSVYKCNCTGLVAEGDITQAVIGEVNTVCELTLSDEGTPTVSGTTPGNITRTAGFAAADQRAIFSVAVAKTDAATARTIEITKGGKKFSSAFDKAALDKAAAYNTVLAMVNTGFVDLGVKTATGKPLYWAECNLGASNPEDPGNYYVWGATALMYSAVDYTKKAGAFTFVKANPYGNNYKNTWDENKGFAWNNTPFTDGVYNNSNNKKVFTKYTTSNDYAKSGAPDNLTTLNHEDDAATAKNASWRMPTIDDFKSLVANCVLVWTSDYNSTSKAGYIVYKAKNEADKGKANTNGTWKMWDAANSKYITNTGSEPTGYSTSDIHIFLPAAGSGSGASLNNYNIGGVYWSSSLATSDDLAFGLVFMAGGIQINEGQRQYGYSIRPVTE